jgi:Ion channel
MATPIFRWRHLALLVSLLVLIISAPELATAHGILIVNVIGAAVLLAASYAISDRKHLFAIAIILSLVSVIATARLGAHPSHARIIIAHTCAVILLSFFFVTILRYVLRSGQVTADKIFAAICAYLLIGYAWAFGYALLDELWPGAFTASTVVARDDYIGRVIQMRYFSFTTLTTVGYGDIVPHSPGARTMAILEAIFGQFYLVALIGRLVGLHIVHGTSSKMRDSI